MAEVQQSSILINWSEVVVIKYKNADYYDWNTICQALEIYPHSPRYYKLKEVDLIYYRGILISHDDMIAICHKHLGELQIVPGVIQKKAALPAKKRVKN